MSASATTPAAERRERLRAALRLPEPLAAVALIVLASACAALLLVRPRAVSPIETPSLVLDRAAVARAIAEDERDARQAPHGALPDELRALLVKQGEMELVGSERVTVYMARREQLAKLLSELAKSSGPAVALRLRAEATLELDAALDLKLPMARAKVVVGSLGQMLAREGASLDGELIAPRFVVRTLFKARWDLLHGLPPDHGFKPIEKQAYYGWEALHAERLPIPQRVEALRAYAKAGGQRVEEALGVLYFRHGDAEQAAVALHAAYEAHPSLRLRNYLLGARAHAGGSE